MSTITSSIEQLTAAERTEEIIDVLDGLVHDTAETAALQDNPYCPETQQGDFDDFLDRRSLAATKINNAGIDAQLQYLSEAGANQQVAAALTDLLNADKEN